MKSIRIIHVEIVLHRQEEMTHERTLNKKKKKKKKRCKPNTTTTIIAIITLDLLNLNTYRFVCIHTYTCMYACISVRVELLEKQNNCE